jgi:hypothetical protein
MRISTRSVSLPDYQRRLLESKAEALEETAARIRFYGQRAYMELVNLHFALHKIPFLPGETARVDFLCIAAYLWPVWQSVYEACLADERVQTRVVLLDRAHSLLKDAACMDTAAFLRQRGIPHISYADYAPDADRPHIVLYQFPYNWFYEGFRKVSPDLVKLRGTRPVYLSYGIEYDEARNINATAGLHYHNYAQSLAWQAFVMHEDIRAGYFRHCRTGGEHVHALGHPRFDTYAREAPPLPEHIEALRRGRPLLLYNIHHPSDHDCRAGRSHSLPVAESVAILRWLAEQADICTVVSLHPLFEAWALEKGRATAKILERMKETIRRSPNAVLSENAEYRTILPHMDACISEQSSLLLEIAFQKKHVLYLYDEHLALKPFAEEIFASFYHGRGQGYGLADVRTFTRRLRCAEDPLAGERQRVWSKYFAACDGRIGQRIVERMLTALRAERSDTE